MLAMDEAEAAYEYFNANLGGRKSAKKKYELPVLSQKAGNIQAAVSSMVYGKNAAPLSRWILELPAASFSKVPAFETAQVIFPEILLDDAMASYSRLHLLIIHWAAYQIRNWTKKIRG
jgi:hypothetical protein